MFFCSIFWYAVPKMDTIIPKMGTEVHFCTLISILANIESLAVKMVSGVVETEACSAVK